MKRIGFGVLFLAGLYGVPFLLIVGLIRRTSSPYLATRAAAQEFGATTDTILTAGLILSLIVPLAGILLAALADDRYWKRHFTWSLAGMAVIWCLVALAGNAATGPLIGWTPADEEPAPRITQCIPVSGGRGCPGG
ncbi:hypothetical protein [Micromonospora sp. WMMD1082]|uniref:hypothetical protein n=1 Tax=Micromonospora sp. WMMD1082 TaxID=3016104 RepID=UPI002417436D|nr:hypothetical protein [Micromonospora sp. WMMD1082]MDG4798169.1 hypothetical protein [Micromonospora sp. WMMD1082]